MVCTIAFTSDFELLRMVKLNLSYQFYIKGQKLFANILVLNWLISYASIKIIEINSFIFFEVSGFKIKVAQLCFSIHSTF